MKKILQVLPCDALGGTEEYVMNHLRSINPSEFHFDFCFFSSDYHAHESEIKSFECKIFYSGQPIPNNLNQFINNIGKIIKQNGPYDVIHAHANLSNTWVMYVAKKLNIPIRISHSHGTKETMPNNLIKRIYFWWEVHILKVSLTKAVACSSQAGDSLYGKHFFLKKGLVLKNSIDYRKFLKDNRTAVLNLKDELNIREKQLVIGNISRFDSNKNQMFIIEIFENILNKVPNSVLILGGIDGGQLKEIKNKVLKMNLTNSVRFIGERRDVNDCLKLFDFYLFPSLYEGFGIALLEAQASGVFCITSKGVPEDANIGLNLFLRISLKESSEFWANELFKNINYNKPSTVEIKKAFEESEYCNEESSRVLMSLYNG